MRPRRPRKPAGVVAPTLATVPLTFAASLLTLAAALLAPGAAQAAKKKQGETESAAWLLPSEQVAPSAAELAKRFPGASAVVVLDAIEHRWSGLQQESKVQRRLRLVDAGALPQVEELAIFLPESSGPWTPLTGTAQLISAEGLVKLQGPPVVEAVDGGLRIHSGLDLSGATAGDAIEILQTLSTKLPSYPPWTCQGALPVLESRLLAIPPPLLTLRAYGSGLPPGGLEPTRLELDDGTRAAGWRFENLPALRDDALSPPVEVASMRLLLHVESFPDLAGGDLAGGGLSRLDWPTWGELTARAAEDFTDAKLAGTLARELGAEPSASVVLEMLRKRLSVRRTAPWPEHASAEAALEAAVGTSADLALLAAAVLRAAGVPDSELVAMRAASRGPVAEAAPVDGNFSELLIRIGERWLDPAPGGGVGRLPARFLGTQAAPLGAGLAGPEALLEARAEDNRLERKASLRLTKDGALRGSSTWTLSPLAAELAGRSEQRKLELDEPAWARPEGKQMSYAVLPWRLFQELDLSSPPATGLIDLGPPRVVVDEIAIELPEEVTGARLCAPATLDAGPAGRYEREVVPDGRKVTVRRSFRLNVTRFGPDEADALFEWLRRVQEAERVTSTLQMR